MNKQDAKKLLDKYLRGDANEAEETLVELWMLRMTAKSELEQDETRYKQTHAEMWNAVNVAINTKRVRLWPRIAVAVSILMVLFAGYYALTVNHTKPKLALTESKKKQNLINWKSIINYATDNEWVGLPDGSAVKVYPGAEVRYKKSIKLASKREVYLTGKAFFEVAKDKKHPFIVYANGLSVTALGTSFTITANPNSDLIKVKLHTGKIWVRNLDSVKRMPVFSKILKPGDVLNVRLGDATVKLHHEDFKKDIVKENVVLNLVQVPLKDVFDKIAKQQHVNIIFNPNEVANVSFTGTIDLNLPVENLLTELTELNKLKWIKSGKDYLIKK